MLLVFTITRFLLLFGLGAIDAGSGAEEAMGVSHFLRQILYYPLNSVN